MLNRLMEFLDGIGMARRTQMLLAGGVGLVLLWGVYSWGTGPSWVAAYSGLDLQDTGRLSTRLEEEGIAVRMERGGSEIQVPEADLIRARIALADEGLPSSGRPGFEIFDGASWGMTDFAQRVNYRRALEGELERTIERLSGVESAKVHLAMQETSAFRRSSNESEASVVLSLRGGLDMPASMVRGITYLVASSVDRIDSDHVTVVDASGVVLSASYESDAGTALTSRQLEAQRDVESHLENKARRLLDQVVGRGNADVRVAATLNFDQVARTTAAIDPDQQAVTEEERAEIIPQPGATGAASSQTRTAFDATRSLEQYSQGPGSIERMTVAVLLNGRPVDTDGVIAFETLPPAELQQIEQLVRSAVGFNPGRGDGISVVNIPFTANPSVNIPLPTLVQRILEWIQVLQKPVLSLVGLIFGFLVAMKLVRGVREMPAPQPRVTAGRSDSPLGGPGDEGAFAGAGVGALPAQATGRPGEIRDRIAARVVEDPGAAARAAGSWLKGA